MQRSKGPAFAGVRDGLSSLRDRGEELPQSYAFSASVVADRAEEEWFEGGLVGASRVEPRLPTQETPW